MNLTSRRSGITTGTVLLVMLSIAACSSTGDSMSGGASSGTAPRDQSAVGSPASAAPSGLAPIGGNPGAGRPGRSSTAGVDVNPASLARAEIKRAEVSIGTGTVASVVSSIETIATSQGGYVQTENTATDPHGVAQSSSITVRVPVAGFAASVDEVARLGRLDSLRTTTVDVTGQVADVASRVTSAKDSIAQLRLLFSRAAKLGDIITLESELSSRESDLEALQAQQRVLTAQTALSTIAVTVTDNRAAPLKPVRHDNHAGFLGGLRQGWDALVTAFQSTAHAVGAALPIGLTLSALGLLAWALLRRVGERRLSQPGADTRGSPRPAE